MTTPPYTAPHITEIPTVHRGNGANGDAGSRLTWRERARRSLVGAAARPRLIQAALDLAAIGFIAIAFTQSAISAEFLFHCVFVMLVLHAFLFGLRGTLLRIALASIPLLVYAEATLFGLNEPPLELTEWPLMFVIAALVAWMADRRNSTSHRYASLFRTASERLITVEEDERRRIAGELHDGVGQVLTALTLTLDAASSTADLAVVRKRLGSARSLADTALAGTRDLSHRIRPARLEERGLVAALRDLAAQSGFPVVVRAERAATDPACWIRQCWSRPIASSRRPLPTPHATAGRRRRAFRSSGSRIGSWSWWTTVERDSTLRGSPSLVLALPACSSAHAS